MTYCDLPSKSTASPNERLAQSVKGGDSEAARRALKDGACPWSKHESECMAMLAIRLGCADVLDVVMEARSSRGKPILAKFAAFARSVAWNVTDRYRVLSHLKKNGPAPLSANPETITPLMIAAWRGHAPSLVALMGHASTKDFLRVDSNMDSALHWALRGGSAECAGLLIPHCDLKKANINGLTPIMSAAMSGKDGMAAIVALLIPHSDLFAKSQNGFTALHWAISNQNQDALEALAPAFPPSLYNDEHVNPFDLCMAYENLPALLTIAMRAPNQALAKARHLARQGGRPLMEGALDRIILSRAERLILSTMTVNSPAPSARGTRRL